MRPPLMYTAVRVRPAHFYIRRKKRPAWSMVLAEIVKQMIVSVLISSKQECVNRRGE